MGFKKTWLALKSSESLGFKNFDLKFCLLPDFEHRQPELICKYISHHRKPYIYTNVLICVRGHARMCGCAHVVQDSFVFLYILLLILLWTVGANHQTLGYQLNVRIFQWEYKMHVSDNKQSPIDSNNHYHNWNCSGDTLWTLRLKNKSIKRKLFIARWKYSVISFFALII